MSDIIVNKVAESGIITFNIEDFYPTEEIKIFDLKEYLFMGLILKEKDFRTALQEKNWTEFNNTIVAVTCTADAIIPMWAYMLISSYLQPIAKFVSMGSKEEVIKSYLVQHISTINVNEFVDKRVVVKGCGEIKIPEEAYLAVTNLLRPVAKSIMYGEPCSTVPIYKKKA